MSEEQNVTPEAEAASQATSQTPKDTVTKSAEQVIAELKATQAKLAEEKATLEKRIKDKESFIAKQGAEIGELRSAQTPPTPSTDDELKPYVESLKAEGMSEEDAKYNAKILLQFDKTRTEKKVKDETYELIEEAVDEGAIDKNFFDENKAEIIAEFRSRKLADSARKNFKIFKSCVKTVMLQKAEGMKKENKETEESQRNSIINSQAQPQGGGQRPPTPDSDKEARDKILNAGAKRDGSAFF